jgi:hypothetical protein
MDKQQHPSSMSADPRLTGSNNDSDMEKEDTKAEVSEYLDNSNSPETLEFQRKEKSLVKKLDLFIAPVMMLLMLISYLDRGENDFDQASRTIDTD